MCLLKNDPVTDSVLLFVSASGTDIQGNRVLIARIQLSIQVRRKTGLYRYADTQAGIDPKPDELTMSRLKVCESTLEDRTRELRNVLG